MHRYIIVAIVVWHSSINAFGQAPNTTQLASSAEKRDETIHRWQEVLGRVPIDEHLFEAFGMVPPEPESSFVSLADQKLSVNLIRDSLGWMREFFPDRFNPCASMVAEGSFAPPPFDDDPRDRRYDFKFPYLSRHRPTKYYLHPKGGLSLLRYEYDAGDYSCQITESGAAMLVRLTPRQNAFDLKQGVPGQTIRSLLEQVLNLGRAREDKGIDVQPFKLPTVIREPLGFNNFTDMEGRGFADWSEQVTGCISEHGLFLVLVKVDIVQGRAIPIRAQGSPNSHWLRRDLYLADGKTLLIDGKK